MVTGPGRALPDLGHAHLKPGAPHPRYDSDPPTSGAHVPVPVRHAERKLSTEQLLEALEQGNVVVMYGGNKPAPGLRTLALSLAPPLTPALAAAGQAVMLARRPGTRGLVGLAWAHAITVPGPRDPQLRTFVQFWLGRGALGPAAAGLALPDGDRHAGQHAQPALGVWVFDLPHPGRAAPVAPGGDGLDPALGDRPQEAGLVSQPGGQFAVTDHRHRGPVGRQRDGDRCVYAAVDQPPGLLDLVGDGRRARGPSRRLARWLEPETVEPAVERHRQLQRELRLHSPRHLTVRAARAQRPACLR